MSFQSMLRGRLGPCSLPRHNAMVPRHVHELQGGGQLDVAAAGTTQDVLPRPGEVENPAFQRTVGKGKGNRNGHSLCSSSGRCLARRTMHSTRPAVKKN